MNCAFEFNTTFSENSIVGEGHNIYPQAFELNDFSYDAFLRFILSNTTGDSMITNKGDSFYETVVNNSSMTTTIVLLVLDILAMYVIPGCKMFFIVGIFILVILFILATAFRVDQEQKFITKLIRSFIIPVFKFMLVTCGMALVVSWFMGEGSTAITGSMETSISVGDPVMVMMLMIVLNCFVVYFYSKILLDVIKDIKSTGKMVGAYMGGVIGSFGGTVVSSVTSNTSYSNGGSHSGKVSAQGHTNPRANERGTVVIERVKEREETVNSFNDRSYGSSKDDRTYGNKSKSKSRKNYSSNIEEKTKKGMKNLSGKED